MQGINAVEDEVLSCGSRAVTVRHSKTALQAMNTS